MHFGQWQKVCFCSTSNIPYRTLAMEISSKYNLSDARIHNIAIWKSEIGHQTKEIRQS